MSLLFFFFLSCIITPGDVLHGSSGHKDALETDGFPAGKAFLCPSRSVSHTAGKHCSFVTTCTVRLRNIVNSRTYFLSKKSLRVWLSPILFLVLSLRFFIFLLWTWAVCHSELQEVICLWWRCSQAGWHPLSVTCRDSEGSKQITFSHLGQHVKLHLIAGCRPLNHDALQDEHFVTDQWNIYRITVSADWSLINWVQLAVTRRCSLK